MPTTLSTKSSYTIPVGVDDTRTALEVEGFSVVENNRLVRSEYDSDTKAGHITSTVVRLRVEARLRAADQGTRVTLRSALLVVGGGVPGRTHSTLPRSTGRSILHAAEEDLISSVRSTALVYRDGRAEIERMTGPDGSVAL